MSCRVRASTAAVRLPGSAVGCAGFGRASQPASAARNARATTRAADCMATPPCRLKRHSTVVGGKIRSESVAPTPRGLPSATGRGWGTQAACGDATVWRVGDGAPRRAHAPARGERRHRHRMQAQCSDCSMHDATRGRILHSLVWGALLLSAACRESTTPPAPPSGGQRLADRYPCDQGIAGDPAVVWAENFEEGSVSAVTSRYQDYKNAGGMALVSDRPSRRCGAASMPFTAAGRRRAPKATALAKRLDTGQDELDVRWYAKYQAGAPWHHTGVWFGGYNPPSNWPNPQAGIRPLGDDRGSFAVEPVWGNGGPHPVLHFYNYWMQMHT